MTGMTPALCASCWSMSRQIGTRLRRPGMSSSVRATRVRFDADNMWVEFSDGRTLGVPLAWFPRLLRSTPEERKRVELSRVGLHWEEIDEDISVAGLLA